MRIRAAAVVAALAASALAASPADARWVSVGVNGLIVEDANSRACMDGIRIDGAVTDVGSIGFTGRWDSIGLVGDGSPVAIERGAGTPLGPFPFPVSDPPLAFDVNGDLTVDPFSETFPWAGVTDARWDRGVALPPGVGIQLSVSDPGELPIIILDTIVRPCVLSGIAGELNIAPASTLNAVRVFEPERSIRVALISSPTFDATTVPGRRLRFGRTGTEASALTWSRSDVNRDGRKDRVATFRTGSTGIVCGDGAATLTGRTLTGERVTAADAITTVDC